MYLLRSCGDPLPLEAVTARLLQAYWSRAPMEQLCAHARLKLGTANQMSDKDLVPSLDTSLSARAGALVARQTVDRAT